MEAVLVIFACLSSGECFPIVGEQTPMSQCMATSQAAAADWLNENPGYTIKGVSCVDPKRLAAILGRGQA